MLNGNTEFEIGPKSSFACVYLFQRPMRFMQGLRIQGFFEGRIRLRFFLTVGSESGFFFWKVHLFTPPCLDLCRYILIILMIKKRVNFNSSKLVKIWILRFLLDGRIQYRIRIRLFCWDWDPELDPIRFLSMVRSGSTPTDLQPWFIQALLHNWTKEHS